MANRGRNGIAAVLGIGLAIVLSLNAVAQEASGVLAGAEAAGGMQPAVLVEAVWLPQKITFYYHSFTTFYPCASLSNKVRGMLLELGAHRDIRVRSSGCDLGGLVPRSQMVSIYLSSPAEATPQVLAELDKTRSTRELVARVRGENVARGIDAQFPAQWKRVSLVRSRGLRLDSADCELVDEFKRRVIPQLAVRIVQDGIRCSPASKQVLLEVEALTAVPPGLPDAAEATISGGAGKT